MSYQTLTVVALTQETADTVTIHLERPDRQPIASRPGQFLTLIVPCGPGGKKERRADRKSTRLNSSHPVSSRMPSSA